VSTLSRAGQERAEKYWTGPIPWLPSHARPIEVKQEVYSGAANVKKIISWIGIGWAFWSFAGGLYFIMASRTITRDSHWLAFSNKLANGYMVVGSALLLCGIISFLGMCNARLNRIAALSCAGWCLVTAIGLQLYTPQFDHGDIDAWLLLICSFSCVMRWALLVLEPYIVDK
jgi:hypothetical protein